MIKVSVIIPIYNGAPYIDQCMNCILGQTLRDIEVICVDDCSTDSTGVMLDAWAAEYPSLKVIHLPENHGAGGARNVGIAEAKGEYIGFMDCDDVIDRTMYEKLYTASIPDVDIVDCAYYEERSGNTVLAFTKDVCGNLNDDRRAHLVTGVGYAVTKIFRRELLQGTDLLPPIKIREGVIYEDLDFLIATLLRATKVASVEEVLYVYKHYATSSTFSKSGQKQFQDMVASMEAMEDMWNRYSEFSCYTDEAAIMSPKELDLLHEAFDYVIINCFVCAISFCLQYQQDPHYHLMENLELLKRYRHEDWFAWRKNRIVNQIMPEANRELLEWFEGLS